MSEPPPPALVNVPAPAPSAPDWAFLLAHPAHGVALGFGSGLLRPAPGTWGTLAGWAAFVVLDSWLTPVAWLVVLPLTFVLGALCAQRTGADLGRADHGAIVIDEILAIWVVLLLLPPTLLAHVHPRREAAQLRVCDRDPGVHLEVAADHGLHHVEHLESAGDIELDRPSLGHGCCDGRRRGDRNTVPGAASSCAP